MTDLLGPASAPNAVTTRVAEYRVFGNIDTWFKPCSSPAAQDGTQLQAPVMNGILAQMRAVIRGNGQLASGTGPVVPEVNTVDGMMLAAIQLLIARGQPNAGSDTGTADALAVAPATPWPEYVKGARLWVIKSPTAGPNATAAPTVAVSNLAAVTIVRRDGSALLPGDLPAGVAFCVEYDGTYFRLVSLTWGEIAAAVQSGKWTYGVATGTANAAAVTLFPAQAAVDGQEILVKWLGPNTAVAPTVNVSGFGVKTVVRQGGGQVAIGDLSGFVPLIYDGTLATWRVNGLVLSDILGLGGVVRVTDAAIASTAQVLVGTASPAISAYGPNQIIIFTAAASNTGAGATLNVTGAGGVALGALTIVKRDLTPIAAADLATNATYIGSPDATGARIRLFGQFPSDMAAQLVTSPDPASLLVNPEFLICQGNYDFSTGGTYPTTFTQTQGQVVYDCWRGGAGGCTLVIGASAYVTVTGVIEQVMEAPALAGETVTVCFDDVSTTANPAVPLPVTLTDGTNSVSGTVPLGAGPQGVSLVIPAGQAGNLVLQVGSASTFTWRRPRVIRGAAVRTYVRRPIGEDLLMCQRYFFFPGASVSGLRRRDPTTYAAGPIGSGYAISATQALIFVPFHPSLQRKPTLEVQNPQAFNLSTAGGSTVQVTAVSLNSANNDYAILLVTVASGLVAGNGTLMQFTSGVQRLMFHSEL